MARLTAQFETWEVEDQFVSVSSSRPLSWRLQSHPRLREQFYGKCLPVNFRLVVSSIASLAVVHQESLRIELCPKVKLIT